ncbi:MAG: bifunctional UDP-N-acetylglucosamine diphosphorylase/glucosamine-1-phosphate N-acetyltransferase GlmU [Peptococcaceae bacterium]|nr:bifunctional UDP-N-acetylglucosamine diphosphorylase/glucosamine-1-phosphate N-acetyltransferase GlmU [Peptococcaceae bacterium]
MPSVAVILAAGMGTRMKSALPKVLHPVAGKPMLLHVVDALKEAGVDEIIAVLGHGSDQVEKVLEGQAGWVYQKEQLGTGHAVLQALPRLLEYGEGDCLVVCGDTPLLTGQTLGRLRQIHRESGFQATILTALMADPKGYGRIIRGSDQQAPVLAIVEEKDADPAEKQIREVNTGAYCFDISWLREALQDLKPANAQGEYYLTDVISFLNKKGQKVGACQAADPEETMGINDRLQLSRAQEYMTRRILEQHMLNGVTIEDPSSTFVEPGVVIGRDAVLCRGTVLTGNTRVGENCLIGPWTRINDSVIQEGAKIVQSTLDGCRIGPRCNIGPYTYMRPGCELAEEVKVGGFVETKKLKAAKGAKIPHLSYIGDATVGQRVNIGAGTITCNYDGKNKYPTFFGDDSFVGSNTNLVAPVNIGEGAYIGAGSTITKDVPPFALAIARERQKNIENWKQTRRDE